MPDQRIVDLTAITSNNVVDSDVVLIVDASEPDATATKNITVGELRELLGLDIDALTTLAGTADDADAIAILDSSGSTTHKVTVAALKTLFASGFDIAALTALTGTADDADVMAIVDSSGSTTHRVTIADLKTLFATPFDMPVSSTSTLTALNKFLVEVNQEGTPELRHITWDSLTTAILGSTQATIVAAARAEVAPETLGATKTLAAADHGKHFVGPASGACTVTVPTGLSAGFYCTIEQDTGDQVTLTAASGVTINRPSGSATPDATRGSYSTITLMSRGSDVFTSGGDLAQA